MATVGGALASNLPLPEVDVEQGIGTDEPITNDTPERDHPCEHCDDWNGSMTTKVDSFYAPASLSSVLPLTPPVDNTPENFPYAPLSMRTLASPKEATHAAVDTYKKQGLQESPVEGYAPDSHTGQHHSSTSQGWDSSKFRLGPRAAELLKEAERCGLKGALPSETHIWDKPAGWQSVEENHGAPAPLGPLSGIFHCHDEHDESRHLIGLKRLKDSSWFENTTPDGAPFFVNPGLHFVTDDYIRDARQFERIQRWARNLYNIIKVQQEKKCPDVFGLPNEYELYLCVVDGERPGEEICGYYLVDYVTRHVFWLHDLELSKLFPNLHERASSTTIDLHLKYEFWSHLSLFSHSDLFPADAEHDARERLKWSSFDMAVARGSMSPYSQVQATHFLDLLDRCKDEQRTSRVKRAMIARLTVTYLVNDICTHFGELGARIDLHQPTVQAPSNSLPLLRRVCCACAHMLVFGSDIPHLNMIRSTLVEDCISHRKIRNTGIWQHHISQFLKYTDQSNIVSTLFLTGNIGFLALSNIGEYPTITTVISTLLSLGSLLMGLHHVRQHLPLVNTFASEGASHLSEADNSWLGYRGLALFYCLPWGLLFWSILWFTLSVFLWLFTDVCTSRWCYGLTIFYGLAIAGVLGVAFAFSWHLHGRENLSCPVWRAMARMGRRGRGWCTGAVGAAAAAQHAPHHCHTKKFL